MTENTFPYVGATRRQARLETCERVYLDWVNNFITIQAFADHYGVSIREARRLIARGKAANSELCKGGIQ